MKKLTSILIATSALLLTACSETDALQNVRNEFGPTAQVSAIPSVEFRFIVRKEDNSVWIVSNRGEESGRSTRVAMLIPPTK